jgi:ankyrin
LDDASIAPLWAAHSNDLDTAELLLGANPNTVIGTGETPLMTCAKSGSVDAVRRRLEYGAATEARETAQNQTALMWAAAEHHPNFVQALIDPHADLKAHSKQGFTAMHFAARQGDQEMAQLNKLGIPAKKLGDSSGQFKELSELS